MRLVDGDAPSVDDDEARAQAASDAAARWKQVVVLKGAHSVVASPNGEVLRSSVASPALATAGSGDVLAGVIGAFLAGGAESFVAAALGVAVHGAAGQLAEGRIGRAGVIARDIAALLPEAIEKLRGGRARCGARKPAPGGDDVAPRRSERPGPRPRAAPDTQGSGREGDAYGPAPWRSPGPGSKWGERLAVATGEEGAELRAAVLDGPILLLWGRPGEAAPSSSTISRRRERRS